MTEQQMQYAYMMEQRRQQLLRAYVHNAKVAGFAAPEEPVTPPQEVEEPEVTPAPQAEEPEVPETEPTIEPVEEPIIEPVEEPVEEEPADSTEE